MKNILKQKPGLPSPMGVSILEDGTVNFAAAIPPNKTCGIILYQKNKKNKETRFLFQQGNRVGSIYSMQIEGINLQETEYNFFVDENMLMDPYATVVSGNELWGGETKKEKLRCGFSFASYDWETEQRPGTLYENSIFYLLHVRGFTMHPSSKATNRGTYDAIIEKIPYLKELGITAIELMPAYEFLETEIAARVSHENQTMEYVLEHYKDPVPQGKQGKPGKQINYWGYQSAFYFTPKSSYSSTGNASDEFKKMVKALHDNQIEIIMQFYFTGNSKQGFILEVLKHWVYEYHIDGIHLLGDQIPITLIATEPMLERTKLLYYDFSFSEIYNGNIPLENRNLAIYQDDFMNCMRKFLKSDEGMMNQALHFMKRNPKQAGVVNYITNCNGFTLADLVSYDRKHNEENGENDRDGNPYNDSWNCGCEGKTNKRKILELRKKQMKNALLLVFLSQGTPLLLSGDEFANSQEGNNNPYCQDNEITWLNWDKRKSNQYLVEYTKELIQIRKNHPILRTPEELTMMDYIACGYPDMSYHGEAAWKVSFDNLCRHASIMYCGKYAMIDRSNTDDFIYIAYNMHWTKHEFALPKLPEAMRWYQLLSTDESENIEIKTESLKNQSAIIVKERSIQVLIGE